MRTPTGVEIRGLGMTKSRLAVGLVLVGVVAAATACGSGSSAAPTTTSTTARPTSSTGPPTGPVVGVASVGSLGTVLVTSSGRTLYRYTPDGTGKSVCTGGCASVWPPLTIPSGTTHAMGGPGVATTDLGTIMRSDGSRQVTFKGIPLYTYTGDAGPGQANGQGLDGTWYVVPPSASGSSLGSSSTTPLPRMAAVTDRTFAGAGRCHPPVVGSGPRPCRLG